MKQLITGLLLGSALFLVACSGGSSSDSNTAQGSKPAKTKPASAPKPKKSGIEKPRGSKITGQIKPGSPFSKIKLGMRMYQVNRLIGAPSDIRSHETGKRWIPFYYGSDARRLQTVYDGQGCLTYSGGNVFGGGANKLIGIHVDPTGACY